MAPLHVNVVRTNHTAMNHLGDRAPPITSLRLGGARFPRDLHVASSASSHSQSSRLSASHRLASRFASARASASGSSPSTSASSSSSSSSVSSDDQAETGSLVNQQLDLDSPSFDLARAILLAGFAFVSYSAPEGGACALEDAYAANGPNQLECKYSRGYAVRCHESQIQVRNLRCISLPSVSLGTAFAKVKVRVGDFIATTQPKDRTTSPHWSDFETTLPIARTNSSSSSSSSSSSRRLFVEVVDAPPWRRAGGKRLGAAAVPIEELGGDGPWQTLSLPLVGDGGGGTVSFDVRVVPFAGGDNVGKPGGESSDELQRQLQRVEKTANELISQLSRLQAVAFRGDIKAGAVAMAQAAVDKLPVTGKLVKGDIVGAFTAGRELLSREDAKEEVGKRLRQAAGSAMRAGTAAVTSGLDLTSLEGGAAWSMLATALVSEREGLELGDHGRYEMCFHIDSGETDTQATLWRWDERRELVLAFRGTELNKWKDILTDLNLTTASLDVPNVSENLRVHSGFLNAYTSVRRSLITHVRYAMRPLEGGGSGDDFGDEDDRPWTLFVTGHSLGGALSTLFALDAATAFGETGEARIVVYNYGSPRVGDAEFVRAYSDRVADSWRIYNIADAVADVPRLLGYKHVPNGVMIDGTKKVLQVLASPGSTFDTLDEDTFASDDVAMSRVFENELEFGANLLQGRGVSEHLEDFYFDGLQEVVMRYGSEDCWVKRGGGGGDVQDDA